MPLTDAQRKAMAALRTVFNDLLSTSHATPAESVEERARPPASETLPPDLSVRVEIAPPSPQPDPTLQSTGILKQPERVPVYFFSVRNDPVDANSDLGPCTVDSEEIARTRVLFYIHGGGNIAGHPTHERLMQFYAKLLRPMASQSRGTAPCVFIVPSYRLATIPENTFPAALQDILAAYEYVLGKGYKPSNVIIAGDSAGGNHAIVVTHLILQSGKPRPGGVAVIAPTSILTNDLLSDRAKKLADRDIISLSTGENMFSAYVGQSGMARTDPLLSGSFLPFTSAWPRTLILVGSGDVMSDASYELEKRLAAVRVPVELVEYDERPHGWWILPQLFLEDILDAAERIARFVYSESLEMPE